MRIGRPQMFMGIARLAAQRSTCSRLNVGSVVVHQNNPVAIGYNGQEPGKPHCLGNDCPGIVPGNCGTVHAEVNALMKAARLDIEDAVDLYSTHSPCGHCVEYIIKKTSLTVGRIFFEVPYRNMDHLEKLLMRDEDYSFPGAVVFEVTPSGYVINHFTREVVELI